MQYRLQFVPNIMAVVLVAVGTAFDARAQSASSRAHLGVKTGASVERGEDGLNGTVAGAGVIVGLSVTPKWDIDAEFWYPGFITLNSEGDRHRDILLGARVRRLFGERIRPQVSGGLSLAWTEDEFTICEARRSTTVSPTAGPVIVDCGAPDVVVRREERARTTSLYLTLGAGVDVPIGLRVIVMPNAQFQIAVGSIIVQPSIALAVRF